jgi:ferredoxin-NADP reductase/DMSO/TMAO reductase YedYZ heme-binding membrane subunit
MNAIKLTPSDVRFGRWLVIINGAIPALLLLWDAIQGKLGANPANFAIRTTGFLALISLVASLVVTPLMRISSQQWLGNFRRALGLYAFFYALAHFLLFFWLDRGLSIVSTATEMFTRYYLLVGLTALILMTPLAVTSTNAAIRKMGPTWWKRLHRLAYVAAIAGVAHYYMLQKADVSKPIAYAAVLAGLLVIRFVYREIDRNRSLAMLSAAPAFPVITKPRFWKGKLKLVGLIDETPDVRTFRFAPADGSPSLPFDYRPGQYLNLSLLIDGQRVNRSYTIASTPSRTGCVEITVKREPMGVASQHLHGKLKVGDVIDVSAPAGKFIFDGSQAKSVVLLAGGVGITPLMSKLRYLVDTAWPGEVFFVYCARSEQDIIFRDELAAIAKRHPNVHVTITLTRAADAWTGERGRISVEMLRRVISELPSRRVHMCGPQSMADDMRSLLISAGVPAEQIEFEAFTSPKATGGAAATSSDAMLDASATHELTFASSGKTISTNAGQTILEAAEANGVEILFDCRSGICGQCKVRKRSGEVAMDAADALTPADVAGGLILACQARCASDVTVDA